MPSFFTPSNIASSGWNVTGTDVLLITSTNRVLAGLATSDIASSKFVVKDRLSVTSGTTIASYLELYNDGSSAYISVLCSNSGTNNKPLSINVGGAERIHILSTGFIGIGTASPSVLLHESLGTDGYAFYTTRSTGATFGIYASTTLSKAGSQSNHPFALVTNDTWGLYIDTSQRVGIGYTTTPTLVTKFTVNSTASVVTSLMIGAATVATGGYVLDINGNTVIRSGYEIDFLATSRNTVTIRNAAGRFVLDSGQGNIELSPLGKDTFGFYISYNSDSSSSVYINGTGSIVTPTTQSILFIGGGLSVNTYLTVDAYGNLTTVASGTFSGVLICGSSGDASAILTCTSTTLGFLPPRMTTTQRDAITTPTKGLIVFNTTTNKLNVRGNSAWEAITSA